MTVILASLLPELPELYRAGIEAALGFVALILFGLLSAASVYVARKAKP